MLEKNDSRLSIDDVMSLITDKSRVMVLNYPNSRTGTVLSYDEVAALAKVAVERDLIVISDEVYEKIIYNDTQHHCPAIFPRMRERTPVVNSFSKMCAMAGLRVGCVYGLKELLSSVWLVHQHTVACVNSLAQYVALAALRGSQDRVKDMIQEFDWRWGLVYKKLGEIEGFGCILPKGAFYVFPNIKSFHMSSEELAAFLVGEAHVTAVLGSTFGSYGEGYIRIS